MTFLAAGALPVLAFESRPAGGEPGAVGDVGDGPVGIFDDALVCALGIQEVAFAHEIIAHPELRPAREFIGGKTGEIIGEQHERVRFGAGPPMGPCQGEFHFGPECVLGELQQPLFVSRNGRGPVAGIDVGPGPFKLDGRQEGAGRKPFCELGVNEPGSSRIGGVLERLPEQQQAAGRQGIVRFEQPAHGRFGCRKIASLDGGAFQLV